MPKQAKVIFISLTILTLLALMSPQIPVIAATSELFISEYIEGSSYNKAIEIYNGTGADVDLSAFIVSAFDEEWKEERSEQWVRDCIRVIKQDSIQHEIEALREKIRQAQASGQPVRPLLEQCQQLEAEKKALLTAL